MPKLVHITTVPQTFGFFDGQIQFMQRQGFDIHAISSPGPLLDEFGAREQIPVHGVEITRQISPVRDLLSLAVLTSTLRRIQPDIVHAHTPKAGLLGMIAASTLQIPARIYHMHGLPLMTASGVARGLLTLAEATSCGLASRVLCVSHSLQAVALQHRLVRRDKCSVIGRGTANGIDARGQFNPARFDASERAEIRTRLGIKESAPVVGFVGRLVRDKGVVELAQAWTILRREFPDAHLLIVGPAEARDALPEHVISSFQQDSRVHLMGFVKKIAPLYAVMDMVVLPTYREGFPYVPLEAAAMQLPVIATQVPGCVDAVEEGCTGTLVFPGDVSSLVGAMRRYLGDRQMRLRHGRSARERVMRLFEPNVIWRGILEVYAELLEENARVAH